DGRRGGFCLEGLEDRLAAAVAEPKIEHDPLWPRPADRGRGFLHRSRALTSESVLRDQGHDEIGISALVFDDEYPSRLGFDDHVAQADVALSAHTSVADECDRTVSELHASARERPP